jgi:protein-disulfide isomerase
MKSQSVKEAVQKDINDGNTVSLTETPTFYINGTKITLSGDSNQIKSLIQKELGI